MGSVLKGTAITQKMLYEFDEMNFYWLVKNEERERKGEEKKEEKRIGGCHYPEAPRKFNRMKNSKHRAL
jgi:hypothetical protein